MFWNNLKVALRNLRKNKLYAVINIAGLALDHLQRLPLQGSGHVDVGDTGRNVGRGCDLQCRGHPDRQRNLEFRTALPVRAVDPAQMTGGAGAE